MRVRYCFTLLAMLPALAPGSGQVAARDLSFEDRVKAQEAIDSVYYSHQVGATRSFEEAAPRALLEARVRAYLRQSLALEHIWKTPIGAAMLRREAERMAEGTRMPERLRQIHAALGNDPFLIQECLARPVLADRLARNFFAYDRLIHASAGRAAEQLHGQLLGGRVVPYAPHPDRAVIDVVRAEAGGTPGARAVGEPSAGAPPGGPTRAQLPPEEFAVWEARAPRGAGEVGRLTEERDRFAIQVTLARGPDHLRLAEFIVKKTSWEEWWAAVEETLDPAAVVAVADDDAIAMVPAGSVACPGDDTWNNGSLDDVPDPRSDAPAVWTGSLVIVWGGRNQDIALDTGARYDPATDTWSPIARAGAPIARSGHSAVWTGDVMIAWGGSVVPGGGYTNTGGRYDPAADAWAPVTSLNAPSARAGHTAVWTGPGGRMVIWGGAYTNTGGQYDPGANTWTATSTTNAPSARQRHTAVWTGRLMIVWGGATNVIPVEFEGTGGRYDPAADTWTATATAGAPGARTGHAAVWTGERMVVWGGRGSSAGFPYLNTGGRYDPGTDTWTPTSVTGAPSPRERHSVVWTGSHMVVWGSNEGTQQPGTGARYDPVHNSWLPTSTVNAPSTRWGHAAVWTGKWMVVWGGLDYVGYVNSGGRYDPVTDTWTPTSTGGAPDGRQNHSATWTGNLMIVWGGSSYVRATNTGGRYDPATDAWSPTSLGCAPPPLTSHPAVWTGDAMIVWGGSGQIGDPAAGGAYDPVADRWTPVSPFDAPSNRAGHTAVWTGREMVVWGGAVWNPAIFSQTYLDTGGRYDPTTDAWIPTATAGAPSGRWRHTAVWTGDRMIVWGGYNGALLNSGGRYDPAGDGWEPIATASAPSARNQHTAVWTGHLMVVWGGEGVGALLNTGGRYDPAEDRWSPTSLSNAPSVRWHHSVAWTGDLMVVWGGWLPLSPPIIFDTGARYDPGADAWTATSVIGAPSGRRYHTAVWTGGFMTVWGGANGAFSTMSSGGSYCLCATTTYYRDADGDGYGDPSRAVETCSQPAGHDPTGGDCSDLDADLWGTPGEAQDLLFLDGAAFSWGAPASPGAISIVYDALRSPAPGDFTAAAACIASDAPVTIAMEPESPDAGAIFFYLVRAQNACPDGQGSLGTDSDGTPRTGRACP